MTGIHRIRLIRDDKKQGKTIKTRLIEAIELCPDFSHLRDPFSALYEIYRWLSFAKKGDKIIIETELEE